MPGSLLPLAYRMLGHFAFITTGAGLFVTVDFSHTITLGSLLIGGMVLVMAGVYTVRSKIATIWREEAEGERAAKERCHEELLQERTSRAEFEKQQQELRHDLKNELAGVRAQLQVMEAKTDLTTALDAIRQMNESSVTAISAAVTAGISDVSSRSESRDGRTHRLLEEIRDKLPSEPITIRDVTE